MRENAFDQADFLRSEKDTRPYWETDHRGMVLPLVKSGYNDSVSYGVPGVLGGQGWQTMNDIVSGRSVTPDEIGHAAGDVAGAAMTGSFAGVRPSGSFGSGGRMEQPRSLDPLGYYSQALEVAKGLQGKGSPDQFLASMRNAGVKQAEIDATGIGNAFADRPSITRDDLVKHLTDNRVGIREVINQSQETEYAQMRRELVAERQRPRDQQNPQRIAELESRIDDMVNDTGRPGAAQFSSYTLDPSNPTYRETVLHLPSFDETAPFQLPDGGWALRRADGSLVANKYAPDKPFAYISRAEAEKALKNDFDVDYTSQDFRSGHFTEPNIVGHMMTSLNTIPRQAAELEAIRKEIKSIPAWGPEAKANDDRLYQLRHRADDLNKDKATVYTLDQIQSDWGQQLRDGGVRDETKIAELKRRLDVEPEMQDWLDGAATRGNRSNAVYARANALDQLATDDPLRHKFQSFDADKYDLLHAELRTAEASSPGHPLVNTTDQWTNTTLRRALQQAIDANADHIAVPSGKTVLGYNPGDTHGMSEFYDKIVPKNLMNILSKLDKTGGGRQFVNQLETPGRGMAGDGFTLFPITPKMREEARKGLPLFQLGVPMSTQPNAFDRDTY